MNNSVFLIAFFSFCSLNVSAGESPESMDYPQKKKSVDVPKQDNDTSSEDDDSSSWSEEEGTEHEKSAVVPQEDRRLFEVLIEKSKIYIEASDSYLEDDHSWVQYLFPIDTPSDANPYAPIMGPINQNFFTQEMPADKKEEVKKHMRLSLKRFLLFLGFEYEADGPKIEKSGSFDLKTKNWLKPGNHNLRRIARVYKSLRLFELKDEAELFRKTILGLKKPFLIRYLE